ncbi:hypothetical protein FACS189491_05220 [Spirochaetia bacterium]|nr:hypothetical protein FACS189491_05220 [Spirochaetia bacterium]
MKERKKSRAIQIPEWMDAAVSELAVKDKRSVSGEIEFLVEAAMRNYAKGRNVSGSAPGLPETEVSAGRLRG